MLYRGFGERPHVEDVPDPAVSADGIVVETIASGICRSDWHGWMGHDPDISLPHVPGHELVGKVVEVGKAVNRIKVGVTVTVPFVNGCGACQWCIAGDHQVCDRQFQPGFTHWGSFAQYVGLSYADVNAVELPEGMDAVAAASLGCRFITAFRAVVDVGRAKGGEVLAVHGCGGVGLSAIMIAKAVGMTVIGVDISQEALDLAERCGADMVVNAKNGNPVAPIVDLTGGGAHLSMDALGSGETCVNSILCLRKRGRHVQVGLMAGRESDPSLPMHVAIAKELEILGSHGMQAHRYPAVFEMLRTAKIDPAIMVTQRLALDDSVDPLVSMDSLSSTGITMIDHF